jgi:phospholipid/cholesterol/gamma-HCH transport system substrate-binding protein
MTSGPASRVKARRRLTGVAFLTVLALLVWLSLALYGKAFTPVATVTLYTDSAGNEMHLGAEVKVRGVQVGEVRQISSAGDGARLELALQPGTLAQIPANVTAQMLPTTLFGERYVDLVLPTAPSPQRLASGSVIRQDRSSDALELEHVLDNLLPLLRAVQPDKLSVTLTAIAQGLQGRGAKLGQSLVTLSAYLHQQNPHLPALDTDIKELAGLARTYTRASPAILQALNDFSVTGQTIADERANLEAFLTTFTSAAGDLHAFLNGNSQNIIQLTTDSIPTLSILARYSPEFPCVLRDLVKFEPNINKVLGQGTKHPGLHVQVIVVPSMGRYLPGRDTPVYGDDLGPHCYPVPFPGIHLHDGTSAPTQAAAQGLAGGKPQALGAQPAGSPGEGALVRELSALSTHQRPAAVPAWADLLLGPVYRGSTVTLGVSNP